MKMKFARTAVAFALLILTSATAQANDTQGWYLGIGRAVVGVNVTIKNRAGNIVATLITDPKGEIRTSSLPPGEYQMEVDGPSLIAAMDRVAPPAKKSSGPSVSIGGFFGGGSSRSSSSHEGNGHQQSRSNSSGGGVGLDLSMPGGDNGSSPGLRLEFEVGYASHDGLSAGDGNRPAQPASIKDDMFGERATGSSSQGNDSKFSIDIPYCRDTAGQGMRIGFNVPASASGELGWTGRLSIKF